MQKHSPISAGFEHMKLCHIPACIGVFILCTMLAAAFFVSSSYAQDSSDSTQTDLLQLEGQEGNEQLDVDGSGSDGAQGGSTDLITNLVNELPEIDLFVYADQSQSIFADPDGDGQKPATKLVEMIRTAINSPISPLASRKVLDRGGRIFLYGFGDNDIINESPYDCSDDIRTFLDGESAGSGEIDAGLQNYEGTSAENKITNLSCVFDHIKNNENINQAQNDNRQPMILIASDFLHDPFNVSTMPVPPRNDFQLPEQGICDFLEGYYTSNQLPPSLDEALVGMDFLERGSRRRYIATLEMQLTREDFSRSSPYSQCAINSAGTDRLAAKLISAALNAERFGFEDLDGNSFAERFAEQMLYAIAPPPVLDNVKRTQQLGSDTLDITFMEPSGLPATIRRLEFGSEATGWAQVSLNQPVELAGGQEQNYTQEIRLPEAQRSGDLSVRAIYTRENGTSELISAMTAVDSESLRPLIVREFNVEIDNSLAAAFPVRIENPNDTAARLTAIRVSTELEGGESEIRLPESDSFLIGAQRNEIYGLRDAATLNRIRDAASQGLLVEIAADGQNLPRGRNTPGRVAVRPPEVFCPAPTGNGYEWIAGSSGYELQFLLGTEEPADGLEVDAIRIAGVADDISIPENQRVLFTENGNGSRANVRIPFLNEQLNDFIYNRSALDITFLSNGRELCTVQEIPAAPDPSEKFQIVDNSWNLRRDADTQNLILEFEVSHQNRLTDRQLDNIYLVATQPGDTFPQSRLNFELVGQETNLIPPGSDGATTVLIDLDSAGIGEVELRNRGLLLISERFDSGDDEPPPIVIPERLLPQISLESFRWLIDEAGVALAISSTYASSVDSIVFSPIASDIRQELVIETPLDNILKLRENIIQNVQINFNDGRGTLRRLSELQQSREIFICILRRGDTLDNCEGAWSRAANFPTIAADRIKTALTYKPQEQKLFVDIENNAPYPETTTGIEVKASNGTTRVIDFPEPLVLPANGTAQIELNPVAEDHQFLVRGGQYSWQALLGRSGLSQPVGGPLNDADIKIIEPTLSLPTSLSNLMNNRLPYYHFRVVSELPTMSLQDYRLEAELLSESGIPLSGWSDSLILRDSQTAFAGTATTPFAASIDEELINQNLSIKINLYAPRETAPIKSHTVPIEITPPFSKKIRDNAHILVVTVFGLISLAYILQFIVYPIFNRISPGEISISTRLEYTTNKIASPFFPSKEISEFKFLWFILFLSFLVGLFLPWGVSAGLGLGSFSLMNGFNNITTLANGIGGGFISILKWCLKWLNRNNKSLEWRQGSLGYQKNQSANKLNIDDNIPLETDQGIFLRFFLYLAIFLIFCVISYSFLAPYFIVPSACEQPADWLRLAQGGCNG